MSFGLAIVISLIISFSFSVLQFPECIQFDVEPHTYPEWNTDRDTLLGDFFNLLESTKSKLQLETNGALCLSAALPVWWNWSPAYDYTYKGITKSLMKHVMDIIDVSVFMDYNNVALNIINYIKEEITYGNEIYNTNDHSDIIIALETGCCCCIICNAEDTFCGYNNEYLENTINEIHHIYNQSKSYKGIAIHYLTTYINRNVNVTLEKIYRQMWVWEDYIYPERILSPQHFEYYNFIKDHKISKLYLTSVHSLMDINKFQSIEYVLNETCKRNVSIDLLLGDNANWLTTEKNIPFELIDNAIHFYKGLKYEENEFCKKNNGNFSFVQKVNYFTLLIILCMFFSEFL